MSINYAKRLLKGKNYSQDNLIPFVVLVVGSFGGVAPKKDVDEAMFTILEEEFSHPIYHETVSHNVPRWRHDIAWAKERAKQHHGYIKGAAESDWGTWELTEKGKSFYKKLLGRLERSVIKRKKK